MTTLIGTNRAKPKVYLIGAISGCTFEEAMEWRFEVRDRMEHMFQVLVPCEMTPQSMGGHDRYTYTLDGVSGHMTDRLVTAKDRYLVKNSDLVIANFSYDANRVSLASMIELGWADAWEKPILMVIKEDSLHYHSFTKSLNNCIHVADMESAIEVMEHFQF